MAAHPSSGPAQFVTGDLGAHVRRMSFAGGVGLLAIFFVDLADLYFISLLGQQELAAAVGFAAAILFFTASISIGLAIAVGSLAARALGAGDSTRAREIASAAMAASSVTAAVAALIVWLLLPELVALVGAKGETARLAVAYLEIVTPSLPIMNAMMAGGALLRAHGAANASMMTTLVAAAANAVLDPLLIFGLGPIPALGLEGAAIASVGARMAGAAVALWIILRRFGGFAPIRRAALASDLRAIFAIAIPAILTNIATPIGAAYLTRVIAAYGDDAVAGYAIVSRITPVAFALVFSLSGAIGPIVGQNYGARAFDRMRAALTEALKFLLIYVVLMSLALFLLRDVIAEQFGAAAAGREMLLWFCGPVSLFFFFNGALFAANASFNNLGRPLISTIANWGRHTLGTMPLASLGAAWFGAPGAMLGQGLGGVIFAIVAIGLAYRLVDQREAAAERPEETPPPLWRWPNWPHGSPRA
ncbi:MAG: MATE family efflux transporter [Neomegalonema sp.]|nr:MATE family efflux transporter [Neomegalonema sp.]